MPFASVSRVARHAAERIPGDIRQLRQMISDPRLSQSYYPEAPRKSRWAIAGELLLWWVRYGEVNKFYYFCGLDRKGVRLRDTLPYAHFRRLRDRRNQATVEGYNYICMLRDKYVFGQFLSSLGVPTPRNLALCTRDEVRWLDGRPAQTWEAVLQTPGLALDVYCKRVSGVGGWGVFPLQIRDGRILIDGRFADPEQLRSRLKGRCLLQERMQQHPDMARLHPSSINSVRIVTCWRGEEIVVLWASMRMGAGGSAMDNTAQGGLSILLDSETGRPRGRAAFGPGGGTFADSHPDTGVRFADFQVPRFSEALSIVKELHRHFYGVHSIGWDVAITPDGPMVFEGNDDWAGYFAIAFDPGFNSSFRALYA